MVNISKAITELITPAVEENGFSLWDVKFLKEGADWFLRIFIDSENGITIDDCVTVSRAIDPIIDKADLIDRSYCMEVCSPGIERELTKPCHFEKMLGKKVTVKLYKAIEQKKEFVGFLAAYNGDVTLNSDGKEYVFEKSLIASVKAADFDNN